jgi:hypothetical protein
MKPPDQHTSDLILAVIQQMKEKDSIRLQDIVVMLQGRTFGLAIVLFCIPNCLPIPNIVGLSAITGIPIIIIGLEMLAGRSQLWLPEILGKKSVPSKRLVVILSRSVPSILKIEKLVHPRLLAISNPISRRLLGAVFAILATIMSLPIPLTNMLPGWAMALMAIGLIERDGIMILMGSAVGMITVFFIFTVTHNVLDLLHSL